MGFDELSYALKLRDVLKGVAEDVVERMRPKYRYARVVRIDRPNSKCDVTFNGETTIVTVNMGATQPTQAGQIVRVEGIGIDKFVTDVIGQSAARLTPSAGWGGGIAYAVAGKTCTVSVSLVRNGGDLGMAAWQPYLLAQNLPRAALGNHGHTGLMTNQVEYEGFQLSVNGSDLVISSRWVNRTFLNQGWAQASFSYVTV